MCSGSLSASKIVSLLYHRLFSVHLYLLDLCEDFYSYCFHTVLSIGTIPSTATQITLLKLLPVPIMK